MANIFCSCRPSRACVLYVERTSQKSPPPPDGRHPRRRKPPDGLRVHSYRLDAAERSNLGWRDRATAFVSVRLTGTAPCRERIERRRHFRIASWFCHHTRRTLERGLRRQPPGRWKRRGDDEAGCQRVHLDRLHAARSRVERALLRAAAPALQVTCCLSRRRPRPHATISASALPDPPGPACSHSTHRLNDGPTRLPQQQPAPDAASTAPCQSDTDDLGDRSVVHLLHVDSADHFAVGRRQHCSA